MLFKKMLRDLKENKGAYIACISIIVIGLMIYSAYSMVLNNLLSSQQDFYTDYNFADGFADVKEMPYSQINELKSIEGINDLQGRLVKDVRVLFPNRDDNVYLRLVSIDTTQDKLINGIELIQGTELDENHMSIWLDNMFFEANELNLNEEIDIIVEGKKKSLRIVGMGRNPEFIYAMRTATDIFPTPGTFGIAYMPYNIMKNLFSDNETVNNIIFTLKPNAEYKSIEELLKPELKPYGLKAIYPRKDQVSHLLLTEEINGVKAAANTLPIIFLMIAAMILYIMLKRMIERQRGQIGILKAFGYSKKEIMYHYLSYAFVIGLVGGILGGLLGTALSYPYTAMYQMYFNMPGLEGSFSLQYFLLSILMSLGFALFAGYQGCKKSLTLEPAEAMRPPAPMAGKATIIEKITIFWHMLTVQGKMAVRNITRHPGRSFFMFLGITFTFVLLALPWSLMSLSEEMLFDQYENVQTFNIKIPLISPQDQKAVERELNRFPGVKRLETMAEVPVTLNNNWHKKDVLLLGLPQNSQLYHILDKDKNELIPPQDGILLSERLAKSLEADIGTEIKLKSSIMRDPEEEHIIRVVGIIPQYLGLNAYMDLTSAQNLLDQGSFCTSIMLNIDDRYVPLLQNEYKNASVINGIDNNAKMYQQSKDMMASFYAVIYGIVFFGIITGFAIVYNSSLITLSERSRDLATMMVLGMTPQEVLSVVTFEQWFISFFAMLAGIPVTNLFHIGVSEAISNDAYTMPTSVDNIAFIMAFLFSVLSIWIAQKAASRKVKTLDLVEVLKARE